MLALNDNFDSLINLLHYREIRQIQKPINKKYLRFSPFTTKI